MLPKYFAERVAMNQLSVLLAVSIGFCKVTSYRSVPGQTDSTPFTTSIGHRTHPFGAAVSPDLMSSGQVCYGDVLIVPGYGYKIVNDITNKRLKRTVDLWVPSIRQEKQIGSRYFEVKVLHSENRKCRK